MFRMSKFVVGISLLSAIVHAAAILPGNNIKRNDPDPLFGPAGAPVLADFDSDDAFGASSPMVYALKQSEINGWMKSHIHPAEINGKAAAYFDFYGTDGKFKSYPNWITKKNPWWIMGYGLASSKAIQSTDPVAFDVPNRPLTMAEKLTIYTGKPTDSYDRASLDEDKLLSVLKTYKESAVVISSREGSPDLHPQAQFAVTNVHDRKVELWFCVLENPTCIKKEFDVKVILDNLDNVGKLKERVKLDGSGADPQEWKSHIANVLFL